MVASSPWWTGSVEYPYVDMEKCWYKWNALHRTSAGSSSSKLFEISNTWYPFEYRVATDQSQSSSSIKRAQFPKWACHQTVSNCLKFDTKGRNQLLVTGRGGVSDISYVIILALWPMTSIQPLSNSQIRLLPAGWRATVTRNTTGCNKNTVSWLLIETVWHGKQNRWRLVDTDFRDYFNLKKW